MDIQKYDRLYRRIKRAVSETTPEKTGMLDRVLDAYTGDPRLLEIFLDRFGNDNPYLATQNAELKEAIFRTKKELAEEDHIHAVSESGHKLKNQLFLLSHMIDPTRMWKSGPAVIKIIEAFGTYEQKKPFTKEGQDAIRQRKKEQSEKTTDNIATTLEEVLKDPTRIKDVQKRTDREKIQTILGLDEEIKNRMLMLDRLMYGNTAFVDTESKTYLLRAEKGGMFFGWFERNLESIPTRIRDIYTTIRSPFIEVPEDERKFMMGTLIAYAAANTPISRESAIGNYQKDMDMITALPKDHELVKKYGKPDLTKVRDILKKNEITLIEATRIFDVYPIDEIRYEVNKEYLSEFKEEFKNALEKLKPLFIQDGKWREDSYGLSVPVGRLAGAVYSSTLTREDYAAVRDMLRIKTLVKNREKGFEKSMSISDFREMTNKVVVAARKIRNMEKKFYEEKVLVKDENKAEEIVEEYKDALLRKNDYLLVENFEAENKISLAEAIKRIEDKLTGMTWIKNKKEIIENAEAGLYREKGIEPILDLIKKAKKLTPRASMKDEYARAEEIIHSPLMYHFKGLIPTRKHKYFSEKEVEDINEILKAEEEVKKQAREYAGRTERLLTMFKELQESKFYIGTAKDQVIVKESGPDTRGAYKTIEDVTLYDMKNIEEKIMMIKDKYAHATEIDDNWFEKAKLLGENSTADTKKFINKFSWKEKFRPSSYILKSFVEEINNAYTDLEGSFKFNSEIVSEGTETFEKGSLIDKYSVKVEVPREFARKFYKEVKGFYYPGKGSKACADNRTKLSVGQMLDSIADFNQTHEIALKAEIYKAQI